MTDVQAMVAEFHGAFGLPNRLGQGKPDPNHEHVGLTLRLVQEEFDEFRKEHRWDGEKFVVDSIENFSKESADLVISLFSANIKAGIDLNMVLRAVHRSNMSKLGEDGKPIYREDGKVLKGPNYSVPNIKEVLGLD